MTLLAKISETAAFFERQRNGKRPEFGLILGLYL